MTPDDARKLAEIEARHEYDQKHLLLGWLTHSDRAWLIAALRESRQREARLREDLDRVTRGTWSKELARLSAVNADLRDENDALRRMQP